MKVTVEPSTVEGEARAPPSKSWAQRAAFLSLLAEGVSSFSNFPSSDDVAASLDAVRAFGASVSVKGNEVEIGGGEVKVPEDVINMRGSGTGARIAIAIGTLVPKGFGAVVTGNKSLRRRPMSPVIDAMRGLGADVRSLRGGLLPVVSFGGLPGGEVEVDGSVTSQHVTAALIASAKSEAGAKISVKNPVSRGYIALTVKLMRAYGARVSCNEAYTQCSVEPSELKPLRGEVPGDYALAAFLAAAAVVSGGKVKVASLPPPEDGPGDHRVIEYLRKFGIEIDYANGELAVDGTSLPRGTRVNLKDEPDLALPLAAVAAVSRGESVLAGLSHLVYKESNRLETILETLKCFGVSARVDGSSIRILGTKSLKRCKLKCPDDHRVAMLAGVLGLSAGAVISSAECVSKSWPQFWAVMEALGARVYVEG